MIYEYENGISTQQLTEALAKSLEGRNLKKVLILPPDFTRMYSGAGKITAIYYDLLKDTDCFFDVSSSIMFMPEGLPETYIRNYGAHRFVYGSDFPMWNPEVEMDRFLKLKLTEEEFEQIAHKTAESILQR